ncbi:hypothetical protein [Hymenobacter cheonanensis]|uniref:hypothetical protein n=1 Tax=Hymenobacter sp. CA2-7 TaxID=3063993 RepID=UPI002713AAB7|nr:hypothetical protein [Hymenobacter sp. CA2-7]MDO7888248.1 hypothetical protein [Hymenobacter sp. CA2-7]
MKISFALVIALLVLGIGINVWQGGRANLITVLGYLPLLAYVVVWLFAWWLAPRR